MEGPKINCSKKTKVCQVCGGVATAFNFSGLTCECCKIFFRRNFNNTNLKCRREGNCEITFYTKKCCPSCRLKKCFSIGCKMKVKKQKHNQQLQIENSTNLRQLLEDGAEKNGKICDCEMKKLQTKKQDLSLNQYEKFLLTEIESAMSVFSEEDKLPISSVLDDFGRAFNFAGNYARSIIKFCKSFDDFKCLSQTIQVIILKEFYFELCSVRFAFYFDAEKDCMRMIEDEKGTHSVLIPFELFKNSVFGDLALIQKKFMMDLKARLNNDITIRNLLIAQFLFNHRENVSCTEFLRHRHFLYRRLLLRYLEDKLKNRKEAKSEYQRIVSHISHENMSQARSNLVKVMSHLVSAGAMTSMGLVLGEVFNLNV